MIDRSSEQACEPLARRESSQSLCCVLAATAVRVTRSALVEKTPLSGAAGGPPMPGSPITRTLLVGPAVRYTTTRLAPWSSCSTVGSEGWSESVLQRCLKSAPRGRPPAGGGQGHTWPAVQRQGHPWTGGCRPGSPLAWRVQVRVALCQSQGHLQPADASQGRLWTAGEHQGHPSLAGVDQGRP